MSRFTGPNAKHDLDYGHGRTISGQLASEHHYLGATWGVLRKGTFDLEQSLHLEQRLRKGTFDLEQRYLSPLQVAQRHHKGTPKPTKMAPWRQNGRLQ